MSAASSLFGLIEHSNPNPVTPTDFQQGSPFIDQFGSGQAGFDNWLTQAVTNNPGLSIGDAYAQYNTGTGTPGSGTTFSQLASGTPSMQAAYRNSLAKITAAGYSPDTPISTLVGNVPANGSTSLADDIAGSVAMGDNPYQSVPTGSAQGAPGASAGGGASQLFAGIVGAAATLFQRGAFVIFGLVLIAAGAYAMARNDVMPFPKG